MSSITTNGTPTNFSYDDAGNMTAAGSTSYQWDAANRLQSVNSGSLGSYGYDGNGKRRKRKSEGGTLRAEVRLDAERERGSVNVRRVTVLDLPTIG